MSKRTLIAACVALLATAAGADVTFTGGDLEVVVAANDAPTVRFAATEMTNFLSRAFGRTIPIVAARTAGRKSLLLGKAGAEAAKIDVAALETDQFVIRTLGTDAIALAGRDHPSRDPGREHIRANACRFDTATLFAAYAFLETDIGCRFYFPGELGECVPTLTHVTVRDCDRRIKPAYRVRHWYDGHDVTWFEGDAQHMNRMRGLNMLRLRMETDPTPCCHGQNAFRYVERFGKSHPEYFLQKADGSRFNRADAPGCSALGQICYSSGAMEELYQDVKAYLTGQPASSRGLKAWGYNCVGGKYVDIMSNDAFFPCHCGKCGPRLSKTDKLDYATEMVWEEVVKIANRLTAEGVKGYVTQMAYNPYRRIPDFDIPTNVLVMVAETGPWCTTDKAKAARDKDEIRRWSEKLGRPVWIWTYPGKYAPQSYPGIPQHTPRAIGTYYKSVSPWIFGTFMESETDKYLYNHLNYYMLSRVSWDPEFDVDATLEEYYRLMFGPAAGVMKAFFEDLERKWLTGVVGNIMDTVEGPKVIQPPDSDIWNKVYTADFLARHRAALEPFAAGDTLSARRVRLFLNEYLKPLEEQSAEFLRRQAGVAALRYRAGGEPMVLSPYRGAKHKTEVRTEVTASRKDGLLVIRYACWEPQMGQTRCTAWGRNGSGVNWKNNGVEIFLNPAGDRQNYYQLVVSENGEYDEYKRLQLGNGQRQPQTGDHWNSRATVRSGTFDGGFTLEIAIPESSFAEKLPESFPANFCRNRVLDNSATFDMYTWSPYAKGYHDPLDFGTITP